MAQFSPQLIKVLQSAIAHHQTGRLAEAAAGYAQVLARAPRDYQSLHLAGTVALQLGEADRAIAMLRRALQIASDAAPTLMCLGLALSAAGQREEAEDYLRRACRRDPSNAEAWGNLGATLVVLGRIAEAVEAYRKSVSLAPHYAPGWAGLGAALLLAKHSGDAVAAHKKALEIDARNAVARYGCGQALLAGQRVSEALQEFATLLSHHPNHLTARSSWLFVRNYLADVDAAELFQDHVDFGRRLRRVGEPDWTAHDASPERRLRVAFLSPDLRSHSIAHFLEPLIEHLDREAFEILLFHDHFIVDEVSDRLRARSAVWRNFVGQSNRTVEILIRKDAPDLLIDLSGHGSHNRLPLYARRLAPVQLTYLGYPNTTGVPEMDYRLTDAWADPPGAADAIHTEKLLRFSPTAWTYQPHRDAPEVVAAPMCNGGPVTFGSFNLAAKLNDFTLALWSRVLKAVPGSRLALKSFGLDPSHFRARLHSAGLDPERVLLWPACARAVDHLACYHQIDIALDPFPYAGTTTTCEALWMGRPVITLAGDRHASRVGGSLLHAIGCDSWIAFTLDDYVNVAARLAAQPEALRQISSTLRARIRASPLLDHAGQAARFGQALRSSWRAWAIQRTSTNINA